MAKFFRADHSIFQAGKIDVPDLCTVMIYHSDTECLCQKLPNSFEEKLFHIWCSNSGEERGNADRS